MKKKTKKSQVVVMQPRSVIYSFWDMELERMKWENENKDKN